MGDKRMFTRSSARSAIGSAAMFARGGAYVQEGRVSQVTVREAGMLQVYEGVVHSPGQDYAVMFEYDPQQDHFAACRCGCSEIDRSDWGCRHVAALMLAACGGTATPVGPREGSEWMGALLARQSVAPGTALTEQEPVRLYPLLRRLSDQEIGVGLRLGRSRLYIVRSMAELAQRAQKRETAVYGRELTFSHREEELAREDVQLFGQIVMLADKGHYDGSELILSGAALDQMMRLLEGRQVDIREEDGTQRRVRVVQRDIALELELEEGNGSAQLCVLAENVVLGQAGAYRLMADELVCAFGETFERISGLLQVAGAYPQGIRFGSGQLEEVCTRLILPAMQSAVMRKGQTILTGHTPTPVRPRMYVDLDDSGRLTCRTAFDYLGTELSSGQTHPHIRRNTALENDVRTAVMRLFPEKTNEDEYAFAGNDDARFALLSEQLPGLERAGEVLVSQRLAKMHVKRAKTMSFGLTQQDGKLTLKADLGGYTQEELNEALAAYRQKRVYVRLSSGIFLSGEALEQAAQAAQVLDGLDMTAQQAQAGAEVPMSRAMYLESALEGRETSP